MGKKLEICCYSVLSCTYAEKGGADRIELCAGRPEGGTTPSWGTVKSALEAVNIPIYVMIRPRGGDFCFNAYERAAMLEDIYSLKRLKPGGFVIGALKPNGTIDWEVIDEQLEAIGDLPVTFHRAFDMCINPEEALEGLVERGVQNILTSGLHQHAIEGLIELRRFVDLSAGRINIMAGSGVKPGNILQIAVTGAHAFHFSATEILQSPMSFRNPRINMGAKVDEFLLYEADLEQIKHAKSLIETI